LTNALQLDVIGARQAVCGLIQEQVFSSHTLTGTSTWQ